MTAPSGPRSVAERLLIIACGAIAHELVAVLRASGWTHAEVECLPAEWHNTPERIVPAVQAKLDAAAARGQRVFVAYGDCGTGGRLDALLDERGVQRLPGSHCYDFFTGTHELAELAEAEPGTFWLTDYLAREFERLVMQGLGIRRHPELLSTYFAHYRRVVWLVQRDDERTRRLAQTAAHSLGLPLVEHRTGLAPFTAALHPIAHALPAHSVDPHA